MADLWGAALEAPAAPEFRPGNLEAKFVAPPFSVLDTRQGYWQDRRRSWLSLGIKSELGRGSDLLSLSPAEGARERWADNGLVQGGRGTGLANAWASEKIKGPLRSGEGRELEPGKGNARSDYGAYQTNEEEGAQGGTSIFDPVLCELMYRWFAPEHGLVLDPFAGGSVRGIVAAKLGHPYTGVDLSGRQLEANRHQAAAILGPEELVPTWLHGDSRELEELLPAGQLYDMVFTCPPYFDLEVYSDDPADLSNAGEYQVFLEGYGQVLHQAASRLLPERFAVVVVSEIRDPAGYCRGFVPDTILAARSAGLHLYNEAVLVNSAGSLPLRVTKYMEASRKLGRAHQNVLVFVKGKPPRGWSWDRTAPPSPQLSLDLEPSAAAPGPAADSEPRPALSGAEPDDAAPGPSEAACATCAAEEPCAEHENLAWVADVEGLPEPQVHALCSRLFCILEAGHANGHELRLPEPEPPAPILTSDGYVADPATGEVLEAPAPPAELAPLEGWDPSTWDASDPDRPCYTCGRPPTGQFRDGSPSYDHSHAALVARGQTSLFSDEEA